MPKITPSFSTTLAWSVAGLFAIGDAIGLHAEGGSLVAPDMLQDAAMVALLLGASAACAFFVPRWRPVAEILHMVAFFFAFVAVTAVATYLLAALNKPLIDEQLATADRLLGLDWVACYKWVKAHAYVDELLNVAYATLIPQFLLLIIILNGRQRFGRAWELMWLFIAACTLCVLFSGLWQAVGAFGYYHIEESKGYVQAFMALHKGALKTIGNNDVQGIVQFPSFHVAMAILMTYAVRGMPLLFVAFAEVNILLLLSTPAIGGHHFADIWGGLLLALISLGVVKVMGAAKIIPD